MEASASDKKLKRELSTIDLLYLSLGGIIGSGWLFAAAAAATLAGPASVYSWIIGGVIVLFIALVYAELGGMVPRSGAIVRYGQYSHGSFAGYMLGWAYFLSAVSVPAIEAIAVITYAGSYTPKYGLNLVQANGVLTGIGIILSMILMLAFFFLNYAGIRVMGKTNTYMTWWKLIIPVGTVLILIFFGNFQASNFTAGGFEPYGFAPVLQAVAVSGIVFSFLGFRQGLDYSGEAKHPQKSVPIATVGSVLIGLTLYVGLQIAFTGNVDWSAVGLAPGSWTALGSSANAGAVDLMAAPFAHLATAAGLVWLTYLLFADAYVSPSGTLNVYLGTSQRTLYGLGTNGYFPKAMMKVREKTGVPVVPLVASLVIGYVFFLPFPSWYKMVGFISSATVFTYIVGGPALRVFRKHAGDLKRPFKLPGSYILSPIAFVGASLIVYWTGWPLVGYLAIAIFLGLVVYLVLVALGAIKQLFNAENVKAGVWVPAYILVLSGLSYIGDTSLGGIGILKFPYDMILAGAVAVVFYIWSAYSGMKTEEMTEIIETGSQYIKEEIPGVR